MVRRCHTVDLVDQNAVQRFCVDFDTDKSEHAANARISGPHTSHRSLADMRADRVPSTKALGQSTPLAALLGGVQDGVKNLHIREADIPALARQAILNQAVLGFAGFHARGMAKFLIQCEHALVVG